MRVVTTRGAFEAAQVVLAAGAWTPQLTRGLGLRLPIEPAKGYSVDVERPADFPELPLYLGDAHVVLTPLGDALRLGSTLELSGWDMRVRPRRVAYLREGGRRAIGLPADGPVRQLWRGPRPVTPDGLPVIGRVPGRDRVILATGHCMLGLSLGPGHRTPGRGAGGRRRAGDRPGAALRAALQLRGPLSRRTSAASCRECVRPPLAPRRHPEQPPERTRLPAGRHSTPPCAEVRARGDGPLTPAGDSIADRCAIGVSAK